MEPKLSNGEIYKKTLTFSLKRFVFNLIMFIVIVALSAIGFLLSDRIVGQGMYGLGIGILIGIVLVAVLSHFFSYIFKAGQIAVMTKAVTEDQLPEDIYGTGKAMVKERFTTVALYYAATSVIKGIFNELGRVITKIGEAVGGDTGSSIGSAISIAISVVVGFLCDCCLGWIFYRRDISAFKATCEGAVIFFKNGSTLLKNLGRMFGIGLASLVVIGGAFFGGFYVLVSQYSEPIKAISHEVSEFAKDGEHNKLIEIMSDPALLTIAICVVLALIVWGIIHGTLVRPFILVGVMRNYMATAVQSIPQESDFAILEEHSKKYRKYKMKNE
ncbi:MAG: hypothetical protein IK152_05660 [Lachnospiraceae bacterium]|nr:hypothetical protein [Lachnospiraceae bacterium]